MAAVCLKVLLVAVVSLPLVGCGGNSTKKDGGASGGSTGNDGGGGTASGGSTGAGGAGGGGGAGCPTAKPQNGASCDVQDACNYGGAACTCVDPGANGHWQCSGGGGTDASVNPAACPKEMPTGGDPCQTAVDNCVYADGTCSCDPAGGWTCLI